MRRRDRAAVDAISRRIRAAYKKHFRTTPTVFISRPAAGASLTGMAG